MAGSIGEPRYPVLPRHRAGFVDAARFWARIPQCPSPHPRSHPPARRELRARARRAHRPVVLVARPRRPRGARAPRGRERLHPRGARAPERAAPRALRRDRRSGAGVRHERAGATGRVRVLHPHRRGSAVRRALPPSRRRTALPDPFAAPGTDARRDRRARRERARPTATTTSRSATSSVDPDQTLAAYSVDTNGGERYELRFRTPRRRQRPRRRRARHLLRRGVGERRRDRLLHASRRRDAPVAGVAPPRRHPRQRRRARVPGGRRPLLRRRRSHPQRSLRRDHDRVEGHERGVAGRRRRARRRRR